MPVVSQPGRLCGAGKQGTVEGYDRHGDLYEYETEGLLARAVQHELDHLDGLVFLRLKKTPPKDFEARAATGDENE